MSKYAFQIIAAPSTTIFSNFIIINKQQKFADALAISKLKFWGKL